LCGSKDHETKFCVKDPNMRTLKDPKDEEIRITALNEPKKLNVDNLLTFNFFEK
jgi:hypothetical protein